MNTPSKAAIAAAAELARAGELRRVTQEGTQIYDKMNTTWIATIIDRHMQPLREAAKNYIKATEVNNVMDAFNKGLFEKYRALRAALEMEGK